MVSTTPDCESRYQSDACRYIYATQMQRPNVLYANVSPGSL